MVFNCKPFTFVINNFYQHHSYDFFYTTSRSPVLCTGKNCTVKPLLIRDFTERDDMF